MQIQFRFIQININLYVYHHHSNLNSTEGNLLSNIDLILGCFILGAFYFLIPYINKKKYESMSLFWDLTSHLHSSLKQLSILNHNFNEKMHTLKEIELIATTNLF
jgi:hypothetical protein